MLIKFLEHGKTREDGKNSARAAANYLVDELDHAGNKRAEVNVLRGDENTFTAICDNSPHLWKYTSAVISFAPTDKPTPDQIQDVLNEFEAHSFAGLEPNQYHLFAVQHDEDDGSKHIHILVPRLELTTGKSLNIAPPGHEKYFNNIRDYFNYKHGWERPDSILNSVTTQEPKLSRKLMRQAEKNLSELEVAEIKKSSIHSVIDSYITQRIRSPNPKIQITDRQGIIEALSKLDQISEIKASKNFLRIKLIDGQVLRLKGEYYNEKFEINAYRQHLRRAEEHSRSSGEFERLASESYTDALIFRSRRAEFNRANFRAKHSEQQPEKLDLEKRNAVRNSAEHRVIADNSVTTDRPEEQRYSLAKQDQQHLDRPEKNRESASRNDKESRADFSRRDRELCEPIQSEAHKHRNDDLSNSASAIKFLHDLSSEYEFQSSFRAKRANQEERRNLADPTDPVPKPKPIEKEVTNERNNHVNFERNADFAGTAEENGARVGRNVELNSRLSEACSTANATDSRLRDLKQEAEKRTFRNPIVEFIARAARGVSERCSTAIVDSISKFFNRDRSQNSNSERIAANFSEFEQAFGRAVGVRRRKFTELENQADRAKNGFIAQVDSITSSLNCRNKLTDRAMPTLVLTRTFQSCFDSKVKVYKETQELITKADADFLTARSTFNDRLLIQTTYRDADVHKQIIDYVKSTETLVNELSKHYRTDDLDYLNAIKKFSDTLKQHEKWLVNVYHNTEQNNDFTHSINTYIETANKFEKHADYCIKNYTPPEPKRELRQENVAQNEQTYERKKEKGRDHDSPSPF